MEMFELIFEERVYYYYKREMRLLSSYTYTYKISKIEKHIRKWYLIHPYAKKLNDEWICSDYRIDQQRPQRKVYSEGYIKIINISEMEKNFLNKLIEEIESEIDYPCVWDDGENRYYEDVIHCPKCGEFRTSLSSKSHCEKCGFEFKKTIKCPKCKDLSLKGSEKCSHCGHKFRKESFINNDDFEVKKGSVEIVRCPKCGSVKSKYNHQCRNCGFDFEGKKQCIKCHHWVSDDSHFCMYCGQRLNVLKKCKYCGSMNDDSNSYCTECGKEIRGM